MRSAILSEIMPSTLNYGAYLYLLWVLVLMPVLGIWSWYRLRSGKPLPPKEKRYQSMIALQIWLLGVTYVVAHDNGLTLLSARRPPIWGWVAAAGYMVVIAQRLKVGWRKLSPERRAKARRLLPENRAHLRSWILISLLAGLSEECSFRGVAFMLLGRLWHSDLVVVVCILSFGLAHALQGWRGVLATSVIAAVMHGLVYLTGGLYMPIALHAAYDLVVGFIAARSFAQQDTPELAQSQAAS